ncbi:hypothetical protein CPB86DRAFT_65544 [Serendipita vermifera]|nr:hypothetical protein CPB86DRAFT_65544 [Serendipita vermifera]
MSFSPNGQQIISGSDDHTIISSSLEHDQVFSGLHSAYNLLKVHHPISSSDDKFGETQSQFHSNPYGPHFSVPRFDNCTLSQDGWVKSLDKLLYWVPPSNRHGLQHPYILSLPITGPHRATWIDFSHFQCGLDWTKVQGSPQ